MTRRSLLLSMACLCVSCGTPRSRSTVPRSEIEAEGSPATESAAAPIEGADPCAGAEGITLLSEPIASVWEGDSHRGGEGPLLIRWCGTGSLHLGTVEVGDLEIAHTTYTRDVFLEHGEFVTVRVTLPMEPGEVEVRVLASTDAGPQSAQGVLVAIEDPVRRRARTECEARGGAFRPSGMSRRERCDAPTRDGGEACRSDADCESICIAERYLVMGDAGCAPGEERIELVGRCHERTLPFGCRARVRAPVSECRQVGTHSPMPMVCSD